MFNGLIREIAQVSSFDGRTLKLRAKYRPSLGDSVAVNGACLSVTKVSASGFEVELSSESAALLATENFRGRVHIEPAMRLGERIDGHLMQGHVDGIGIIERVQGLAVGRDFFVRLPRELLPFVATKGSIGVDGVSLTVNETTKTGVRLTLIPLSLKDTLFADYREGRRVNIETDLLARYAARILGFAGSSNLKNNSDLTWDEAEFYAKIY